MLQQVGEATMNTLFCLLLCHLVFACLSSRALAAVTDDKDERHLGVRLGLDKIFDANAYCVLDERTKLRDAVRSGVGLTTRKLRDSRQLKQCAELCDDSAPGHCFLGHQECQGWRRLEESSAVGASLSQDFVDPESNAEILLDVSGGRFMPSKRVITPSMRHRCREATDTVVNAMKELSGGLSDPCKRLLRKEVQVECFIL